MDSIPEHRRAQQKPSLFVPVAVVALCMVSFAGSPADYFEVFRRNRSRGLITLTKAHVNQYPFNNFLEVDEPNPIAQKKVIGFYWQIPRCGGTTLKHIMGTCLRRVQAARTSVDYCDTSTDEVQTCQTKVGTFVNADPSDHGGIQRCERMGLITSDIPDVIVSSRILHAATLYDPDHLGRLFTIMRNPIERAVSTFYYLQNAYWERHYRPELKDMTILDYAALPDTANNWMTRWLTGKNAEPHLTRADLEFAKELLRRKFMILLTDQMAVSLERLMYYMKWRIPEQYFNETKACLMANTGKSQGQNRNKHLMPDPGSPEYEALKAINDLDLELFEYAKQLFQEQEEVVMKRKHTRTGELFLRDETADAKKDAVGKASQSSEYEAAMAAAALMERPPDEATMKSVEATNNLVATALFLSMPNMTATQKKDESRMIASVMSKRQGSAKWNQFRNSVPQAKPLEQQHDSQHSDDDSSSRVQTSNEQSAELSKQVESHSLQQSKTSSEASKTRTLVQEVEIQQNYDAPSLNEGTSLEENDKTKLPLLLAESLKAPALPSGQEQPSTLQLTASTVGKEKELSKTGTPLTHDQKSTDQALLKESRALTQSRRQLSVNKEYLNSSSQQNVRKRLTWEQRISGKFN